MTVVTTRETHVRHLTRLAAVLLGLGTVGAWTLVPSAAVADDSVHPEWGSVQSPDGTLLRGCNSYQYTYAITPPQGNWSLEVFITGPDGQSVGTPVLEIGSDPLSGTRTFDLCKPGTDPGVFTITPRLSVIDGVQPEEDGFLPTTTFTLAPPPKRQHHQHGVWHLVPIHRHHPHHHHHR